MTLVRLSLRLHRNALAWMGLLLAFVALVQGPGYLRVAGTTQQARARFAQAMEPIGQQMSFLLPPPRRADTLGGFVQWRAFGLFAIVMAFWAVIAGSGVTRGDEARGLTEQWLSTGRSRRSVLLSRSIGFALASTTVVSLCGLGTLFGARSAGEPLSVGSVLSQLVALEALTLCCFAVTVLAAQFARSRRSASGLAGVVVGGLFLLNGMGRGAPSLDVVRFLSPFFHYERTQAITPGGSFDGVSTGVLALASVVLGLAASWAFGRRDLDASVLRAAHRGAAAVHTPSSNPMVRGSVRVSVYEQRLGLAVWALGTATMALGFASMARSMVPLLEQTPFFRAIFAGQSRGDLLVMFLGRAWSGALELVLALFAVTQVSRWVADDLEGRLEMVLSTPTARRRVVLDRALSLAASAGIIAGASVLAMGVASAKNGLGLRALDLLLAAPLLVLFSLMFGAIGGAMASRAPRLAVPAVALFAVASYLLQQVGPMFAWPRSITRWSAFELYGAPLAGEYTAFGIVTMVAVTLVGFGLATYAIEQRDLGR